MYKYKLTNTGICLAREAARGRSCTLYSFAPYLVLLLITSLVWGSLVNVHGKEFPVLWLVFISHGKRDLLQDCIKWLTLWQFPCQKLAKLSKNMLLVHRSSKNNIRQILLYGSTEVSL